MGFEYSKRWKDMKVGYWPLFAVHRLKKRLVTDAYYHRSCHLGHYRHHRRFHREGITSSLDTSLSMLKSVRLLICFLCFRCLLYVCGFLCSLRSSLEKLTLSGIEVFSNIMGDWPLSSSFRECRYFYELYL